MRDVAKIEHDQALTPTPLSDSATWLQRVKLALYQGPDFADFKQRMNISILLPDLRGGGAERVNLDLAHEFARAGHDVEFVLMQPRGELLEEAKTSFPVVDLATPRARGVPFALIRYLRRRRPDALLAAMWPLTGIAGLAARLSGYRGRLVVSEHVDFRSTPSFKAVERLALRHLGRLIYAPCNRVVAVSNGVADSLEGVAGLPRNRIEVIHNPVRTHAPEIMCDDDQRALEGWLHAETRLIAIGTLKRQKGFDVLLRALADLRQRRDARLLILGEGALRGELEVLARDLGVADSLWMLGFRSNPGTFLQHAHVFVLSSNWEGFGNVIVEALSAGVPVVSTDCPSGPFEILEGGRYGRLVAPSDANAMASAIETTRSIGGSATQLKARAKEFNPVKQAAYYLELLSDGKRRNDL